jgi:hypothetical protein
VLQRNVQEGAARLGEDLVAVAEVPVDVDPPAAAVRHPGRDPKPAVDEDGPAVADEHPRRDHGEAVPGSEQAARLVERRADEPAVDDPGCRLVNLFEAEARLIALRADFGGQRKMDAVRVLLPATPARGVVVRRDLYRRPPRSKCAL